MTSRTIALPSGLALSIGTAAMQAALADMERSPYDSGADAHSLTPAIRERAP